MDWSLLPLIPVWAILLVAMGLIALLAHGSLVLLSKKVPGRWVALLGTLRLVAVFVFIICLLRPIVSYTKQFQRSPSMMVLVDTSQSMQQAADADGNTRLDSAVRRLDSSDFGDRLQEQFDVRWYAFDRDARPIERDAINAMDADGETTNLADSLRTAWAFQNQLDANSSKQSTAAGRVVLVTDGNDQAADEAVAAARELGLKVFTLPPESADSSAADASVTISNLQSPSRILIGSEGRFQATIRHLGAADQPMVAQLAEDGRPVVAQEFTFGPGDSERQLTLTHRPTNVGNRRYTLTVSSQKSDANIKTGSAYDVNVKVVGRAAEVLVLEDRWRWEFKYLRRVLEADPNFAFTSFISRGPATYLQFAEPESNVSLAGFPRSGAELEWFDVVVLGDVNPSRWPQSLAPSLYRLVSEQGKSLVVIAGPGIQRMAAEPSLRALLPVEVYPATAKPVPGPVELRLTPEGAGSPFFYTPAGAASSPWADLPPVDQFYMPLRKRPAATVLLDAPSHSTDFGSGIVMAEHTVGKGRVLYIGTDTLWKWQMLGASDKDGITPYQVFWQQALRALAPRTGQRGNVNLALDPDRTRYRSGETIGVQATLNATPSLARPELDATAYLPSGEELPVVLVADPSKESAYRARIDASEEGTYRIVARVSQDGTTLAETTAMIDVEEGNAETAPSPVNTAVLQQLANSSGGRMVSLEDPSTWPQRSDDEVVDIQQAQTLDLWNNWILVLLLIGILGADWLIRLLRGFV